HVDLNELEEYCVNELNGMSKARILSKLTGKPMLESSDTNESDDSGPSLEIISDTEEWLTDDDTSKKENGRQGKLIKRDKVKIKRKAHIKKNDPDKTNSKAKCSIKNENSDKTNKNVKIKKEDDKGKEGDSLLDLLELEMRARAIRALIRKEEDIIPSTNPSETSDSQTENNIGTPQDDDKAKETYRKQLEKIISAQQSTKGEEEDVVLVIQPTPVVELLSSDSDGEAHGETRVNQKLKNKRAIGKSASNSDENAKNSSKTLGTQVTGTHTYTNTNIVSKTDLSSETRTIMPDRNVDIKNNTLSISISANNVAERRKKSKKKSHAKSQLTSTSENTSNSKQINTPEIIEQSNDVEDDNTTEQLSLSDENKVIEEKSNTEEEISKETRIEEERLADLDEVIDLDDYCDVMDIENCDEDNSQDEVIVPFPEEHKQSAPEAILPKSDSMETWTSRYYQTDDVQNVIKESKIQSEIRKRLRERQRLSKLSKSPNLNSSSQSSTDTAATSEKIPTGSVEEYLALKRAMNANVSTNSNNNTTQDNSETINSDVNVKEMSVQDESISSQQEYTDNDAQKAITSEITESTKLAEADTKHDTQLG
ncbi:leucine-rich repeat-containing protein, partial [Lasius niger]